MDKNKLKKAISEQTQCIFLFYNQMKWILSSKRGRKFQFMMLDKTFDSVMQISSQMRAKHIEDEGMPKSPMDMP